MKSFRYATYLSLTYLGIAGIYIRISSHLAASLARTVDELETMERFKGQVFVIVTGGLLWGLSWFFFSRLQRSAEERARERHALMLVQSKAYAGELAATVAHDFNNLLLVLRSGVDEVAESGGHAVDTTLSEMRIALDGAKNLTERLARAAKGDRAGRQDIHSLASIVTETTCLIRKLPRLSGRTVEVVAPAAAFTLLDPVVVEQIVVNLLLNAADACGKGGTVRLDVGEDAGHVWLVVHDNGPGLPDSEHLAVVEPIRSTKGGLGLGLLSVRACAEAGNGQLTIGRSPLGGARFEVRWPRVDRHSSGLDAHDVA
jgi:two-component system, NtrC family, C4-dicarboxylate transport sensor histidine kinase DctB